LTDKKIISVIGEIKYLIYNGLSSGEGENECGGKKKIPVRGGEPGSSKRKGDEGLLSRGAVT
jgi:hypothetical protein